VDIATNSALDAANFVAVALEDYVRGVSATLGAVALGFAAVGALIATEVALEDLVHQSISELYAV
jgi:hypothetical protein